jgi:hypothetical protein
MVFFFLKIKIKNLEPFWGLKLVQTGLTRFYQSGSNQFEPFVLKRLQPI